MRTIKFRGKDIRTNEWAYGDLHTLCDQVHIHTEKTHYPYSGKRSFVVPETIGQFTGLYDKNGKEIYEGDILQLTITLYGRAVREPRIRKVIWKDCGFSIVNRWLDCVCETTTTTEEVSYEVIGNIHDNPELLEK